MTECDYLAFGGDSKTSVFAAELVWALVTHVEGR